MKFVVAERPGLVGKAEPAVELAHPWIAERFAN
jgi:hypothetical protein